MQGMELKSKDDNTGVIMVISMGFCETLGALLLTRGWKRVVGGSGSCSVPFSE